MALLFDEETRSHLSVLINVESPGTIFVTPKLETFYEYSISVKMTKKKT